MEFRSLNISDLKSLLELYQQLDKDDDQGLFEQSGAARIEAHRFYEHVGFNGASKKAFDMRLE